MKEVFAGSFLFLLVAATLIGCSANANSYSEGNNRPANAVGANNSAAKIVDSEYPPLAEKIATAELRHLDETRSTITDRKGKVVLLNMWATWCGPCRSEMPALVRLQESLGAEGFEVIGLNVDNEPIEAINPFAEQMKLNYPLVWPDEGTTMELMKISKFTGIPQSFLIDREGRLRGVFRGANPRDIKEMEKLVVKVVNEG